MRGEIAYISSICDISNVCSHKTFLPNTSVEPLSKSNPKEKAVHANIELRPTASFHDRLCYFRGNILTCQRMKTFYNQSVWFENDVLENKSYTVIHDTDSQFKSWIFDCISLSVWSYIS